MRGHKGIDMSEKLANLNDIVFLETPGFLAFRKTAGDVNRYLNVAVIGLETLKNSSPILPPDLAVYPQIPESSDAWKNAEEFVISGAIALIFHAADEYLRVLPKLGSLVDDELYPTLYGVKEKKSGKSPSIGDWFERLNHHYKIGTPQQYLAILHIFGDWRNIIVHSTRPKSLRKSKTEILESLKYFTEEHPQADVESIIAEYEQGLVPSLRNLSTIISCLHRAIRQIDERILSNMTGTEYLIDLTKYLISSDFGPQYSLDWIWEHGGKKAKGRLIQLIFAHGADDLRSGRKSAPRVTRLQYDMIIPNGINQARLELN